MAMLRPVSPDLAGDKLIRQCASQPSAESKALRPPPGSPAKFSPSLLFIC